MTATEPRCWCGGAILQDEDSRAHCVESKLHDPLKKGGTPFALVRRLYIAGPMTGYVDCNYPAFNEAARSLEAFGYEVLNPATDGHAEGSHYTDLLREDLEMMLKAEGVATLPDWEFSTGARNEVMVAGLLRMPVRPVHTWLFEGMGRRR